MYSTNCILLFLFAFCAITAQAHCPEGDGLECSGYGRCIKDVCYCFYGHDDGFNCDIDLETRMRTIFRIIRSLFCIYTFVLLVLTILRLIGTLRSGSREREKTLFNIKKLVLVLLVLLFIFKILHWAVDPYGYEEWLAPAVHTFFETFPNTIITAIIVSILFHWIDIYNTAIRSLKKEEMLTKINKNYESQGVSVDDILKRVSFLQKLKVPFILAILILLGLQITINALYGLYPQAEVTVNIVYSVMLGVIWVTAAVGFLVYGRKLISLMPGDFAGNLKRATYKINACCILELLILLASIIFYSLGHKNANPYIWLNVTTEILTLIMETLFVFILVKRKSRFWCLDFQSSETGGISQSQASHSLAETASKASTGSNTTGTGAEITMSNVYTSSVLETTEVVI